MKNIMKYLPIAALIVALVAIGMVAFKPSVQLVGSYVPNVNGAIVSVTTSTSITASQLCSQSAIYVSGISGNITVTLPSATSTYAGCGILQNGGVLNVLVSNTSPTSTVTIAGGTGVSILKALTSGAAALATSSQEIMTLFSQTSSTLYVGLSNPQH